VIGGLALLGALLGGGPAGLPREVTIAGLRAEARIPVRLDGSGSPVVPAGPLVAALGGQLRLDSAWAEVVVQGANNPRVIPGAPGRVDASRGVPVLEIPAGRVDRSMGDVHPSGNPHYTLDPALVAIAIANIEEGLARVTPEHRAVFERNRRAFLGRLEEAMARWSRTLGPARGAKVVVYHNNWVYFLARFGLVQAGTIEERPGIPPGSGPPHPAHPADEGRGRAAGARRTLE